MSRASDKAPGLRVATLDEVARYGFKGGHRALRERGLLPPMAGATGITFDQPLGSGNSTNASTVAITTTQTAAAGSRIVVCASWFDSLSRTITSVSDGTAYTADHALFANGNDKFAIYSRVLVGSLASGSTITLTFSASFSGTALLVACSYLGTTGFDTTATNTTTGTGFSSGAASNSVADALFVGGAGNETAATSVGTTNTNGTPRFDIWNSGAQQGIRMLDVISSSVGSQALTGSWGPTGTQSSTATTGILVIYKGTGGAAGPAYVPHRMLLGV